MEIANSISIKSIILLCVLMTLFLYVNSVYAWLDGTPILLEKFGHLVSYSGDEDYIPHAPNKEVPLLFDFKIGEQRDFNAVDFNKNQQYIVSATLRSKGEHCYIFVENGEWNSRVTPLDVEKLRRVFEDSTPGDVSRGIYQIETQLIGVPPDIDNDTHIYILLLDIPDSYNSSTDTFIAGYFNPVNQQRGILRDPMTGARVKSNEIEIIYLDTNPLKLWLSKSHSVLAHEFQHLLHWEYDSDEDIWVNEGCSEYAMFLCGYSPNEHIEAYEKNPDVPLTYWPSGMKSELSYYGSVYLWMLYLHEHYGGEDTIGAIVRNKANGISGINSVLQHSVGEPALFDSVFADWKVANYLDEADFEDGRYGYNEIDISISLISGHHLYPFYQNQKIEGAWASDYISFDNPPGNGDLIINFINNSPYRFDIKLIELNNSRPVSLEDLKLTNSGTGSVRIIDFGRNVNRVVMVPSIQPSGDISGLLSANYSYETRIGGKVSFKTNIIPNPIHKKYWDIVAISNESLGADTPLVTVISGNTTIAKLEEMQKLENGNTYTYQIYLPANQSDESISKKDVIWEVYYFNEKVGEGKLVKYWD